MRRKNYDILKLQTTIPEVRKFMSVFMPRNGMIRKLSLRSLGFLGVLILALSVHAQPAYTNHAGYTVSGVIVSLDATSTTISNATESVSVPLSIFPETERRRIAADYVLAHPDAGVAALLVPDAVKKAVAANAKAMRRAALRAEKGLCSKEESETFRARASAALKAWLDEKQKAGVILPSERRALVGAHW